jgi:hypothetical protein
MPDMTTWDQKHKLHGGSGTKDISLEIVIIVRIHKEMSQGNSLYSYLKQKCHFFLYIQRRTGGQNRSCLGTWYLGSGEKGEKKA